MTTTPTQDWTTRALLRWMTQRFTDRNLDGPRVVAEMLLAEVFGCDRMRLYMEADRVASPEERERLRDLVRRASDDEPVQYLVGWATFYGRPFFVEPCTLIPQPCTEDLVDAVVRGLPTDGPVRVAELGTGCGCIAVTLALHRGELDVVATDLVADACSLAQRNGERHGVADRVEIREGNLFEPLAGLEPFDALCANLPYIPDSEWDGGLVEPGVRNFVPASALRGGPDGLALIRPVIADARNHVRPGGPIVLEVASSHADVAAGLARDAGWRDVTVVKDYEGLPRLVCGVA